MKTIQTNEKVKDTFTMINDNLLSTPVSKITAQQKIFISWILRFQKNGLECFATNKTIGETLGMTKDGVKSLIKSCSHSFPFFTCTPSTRENGVPFHIISIDVEMLFKFISEDKPVTKIQRRNKPSTENKAPESTISTQDIPEVQVEEKVSEIEEKQVQTKLETLRVSYKEKFDKIFAPYIKRDKIYPMQWGHFREITNDKYSNLPGVFSRTTNLTSHNFDEFWNVIENLETELVN